MSADSDIYAEKASAWRKFAVFVRDVDFPVLKVHSRSDTARYGMKSDIVPPPLFLRCCQCDTVHSRRKLDYPPAECIMISLRFESSLVLCLRFGKELAVVRP